MPWPWDQYGMMGGGYQPPVAGMLPMGGAPMFGGGGPRYTGPFNMSMGNDTGRIFQMLAPMLLNSFMGGTGRTPFQLFPEQNLADQMRANDYYRGQLQASSIGAARDAMQATQVMQGITRMRTGRNPNMLESATNAMIGQTISNFTPMLTQLLGPMTVDALYGSRGSSAVMAQELHAAMRTRLDPVTGQPTFSGRSAGVAGQEVFERLFGARATGPMGVHGLSAGQAGMLANELQMRGLLGGSSIGATQVRALGSAFYDESFLNRAADRMVAERASTDPIARDRALAAVRGTRERLLGADGGGLSVETIGGMAGGGDFLRAGAAGQMADRVRSLSGVVRAMRDIFGDMGNPNAPMRELLNGLDALTQGSITQMNPAQLEAMVRRSHNIATQTGIGIQGLLGLTAQGAAIGDQLGLARSLAVPSAQNAALYGAAMQDTQRMDLPIWGRLNQEQVTLLRNQLNVHAAASPLANNLGALRRMRAVGLIPGGGGTETQALLNAVENGQSDYTFNGQTRDVRIPRDRFMAMLNRDHGITPETSAGIIADRSGNQEFIAGSVHELVSGEAQRREMRADAGRSLGNVVDRGFQRAGTLAALRNAGVARNSDQAAILSQRIGNALATDAGRMSYEMIADPRTANSYLAGRAREHLREQIHAANPGMTAGQLDAAVGNIGASLGPQGFTGLAAGIIPQMNRDMHGGFMGWRQVQDEATANAAAARSRAAEAQSLRQSALAGFGQTTFLGRISDTVAGWIPGTSVRGALGGVLGGIDLDHPPGGPNSNAAAAARFYRQMAARGTTRADIVASTRDRDIIRGLLGGGHAAQSALELYGPSLDADTRRRLDHLATHHVSPEEAGTVDGAGAAHPESPFTALGRGFRGLGGLLPRAISEGIPAATRGIAAADRARRTLNLNITGTLTMNRDGTVGIGGTGTMPMTEGMSFTT